MIDEKLYLRKVEPGEWIKVLKFEKASRSKFFSALENEEEVKQYLSESEVYFVMLGNEPIGTASFKSEGDSAYMDGLTIDPKYRGKGYGKIGIHLIMEKVKKYRRVYLRVHPRNVGGIIVYLKEGFEIFGWEDNHYGDNEPRLLMEKLQS